MSPWALVFMASWFAIHVGGLAHAGKPLNVLFIGVDDMRPAMGCYGDHEAITPNLDRLAASSLRFDRAYCQMASCSPSRSSLLTGKRPDRTRVFDNRPHFRDALPDVITLPQQFKKHGYHTQSLGKIFHGIFTGEVREDPPSWSVPAWRPLAIQYRTPEGIATLRKRYPNRFNASQSLEQSLRLMGRRRYKGLAVEWPDVADNQLIDGAIADKAVEVLQEIKDRPFFLAVGFVKPHAPFVSPKKFADLYSENEMTLPKPSEPPRGAPSFVHTDSKEMRGYTGVAKEGPIPVSQAKHLVHGYRACVSYVDAQVGRVLAELDRLGLRENTVIVFWSDHGYHTGHNGQWCKNTNLEAAVHVPLIVSAPGMKSSGESTTALVELIDLYPTLSEICRVPAPDGLEGTSFAPLLDSPNLPWKKGALSQHTRLGDRMGRSIRTARYRLTEWTTPGKDAPTAVLYDYESEVPERENLADDPKYQDVLERLTKMLHAGWRAARPPVSSTASSK